MSTTLETGSEKQVPKKVPKKVPKQVPNQVPKAVPLPRRTPGHPHAPATRHPG